MLDLFGIDPRSLAVFRIALGALLLADLAIRATDLKAMYTDSGMFPRTEICYHYTTIWNWSFHFAGGSFVCQSALFVLAGVVAFALLVGFETRLATIGSWLLLLSLHHRVPPIQSGADVLLRMLLFWAMFLPLERKWSLDAWLERRRGGGPTGRENEARVLSVASAAILLQMALMYLFSAIFKSNSNWLRGEAVAGSMAHDFFASPLGAYLLHFPRLLRGMTWSTFALEWIAPILLFFPKPTARLRLGLVAALVLMHLGIAACLEVDLFSPVAIAGLVLFLPAEFWNSRFLVALARPQATVTQLVEARPKSLKEQRLFFYLTQGTCALLLLYLVVININSLPSHPLASGPPAKTSFLKTACGLGQKWSMFDEAPSKNGWYVAWARLKDGSDVDLLRQGASLNWTKPRFPAGMYPNYRWRKCFREMAYTDELGYQVFRAPVAEFLCRDWNARNQADRRVVQFDLIYCNEPPAGVTGVAAPQTSARERLVHLDFTSEDGRVIASGV